jgi:hypothetical protein
MTTEGGAFKKKRETKHSGEYKPQKKRKNKTKKNQKKNRDPNPRQALNLFFLHTFLQRYELTTTNKKTTPTTSAM